LIFNKKRLLLDRIVDTTCHIDSGIGFIIFE